VARLHTRTSEAPAALDNILPALHKASRHKNARGSGGKAPRILKVMQGHAARLHFRFVANRYKTCHCSVGKRPAPTGKMTSP
jgi:hypothetical protein